MQNSSLRALLQNRKKEVWLLAAIFALLLISVSVNSKKVIGIGSAFSRNDNVLRMELKRKQAQLTKALEEENRIRNTLLGFGKYKQDVWLPERDGNSQQELRRIIETTAKTAELKLKTLGTIQEMKIVDGLHAYQVNIMADAAYENILRFMDGLQKRSPKLFWKNLTITPDNAKAPNFLILNGTIQIVVISSPEITEKLWSVK